MKDDRFEKCRSRTWLNSVRLDIRDQKANREDVELAMEYFCDLQRRNKEIPYEMLKLMEFVFSTYLKRRHFNGALEAAFGFTGKQGARNLEERDEQLACDIARYHLTGMSLTNAKMKVCEDSGLKNSTIEEIWRKNKQTGIISYRINLRNDGKQFSEQQKKRAEKALAKQKRQVQELLEDPEN